MSTSPQTATAILAPFLRYQDAPAAIAWLERAFGFERHLVIPDQSGGIAHAELRYAGALLMVGSARADALGMRAPRELGAVTQGIYIAVADVAAHYARALAAGAGIVRPLADTDYGSREYLARDLEGHLWSFGTYLPGAEGSGH